MSIIANIYKYLFCLLILTTLSFTQIYDGENNQLISDQDYITGEDGVVRMYVNILGHVKNPGAYLVYDGIDFISIISLAGGISKGADLKNIKIINNETISIIDFNEFLNDGKIQNQILIQPHTTIYIEETLVSNLFRGSNLLNSILQIFNIALTLERTSD